MGLIRSSSSSSALKWLGFVTAVWVQAISGNNYTFSNYSDALKSLMNLTQLELNSLSVAKDIGKAFGILAGLASDRLSTPVILLIGCFEGLLGYGVQWLVVSRTIQPLPYWQVLNHDSQILKPNFKIWKKPQKISSNFDAFLICV